MANPAKAKGTRWETAICRYLQSLGISAHRPNQISNADLGDIHGITPFVGQAKNWANTTAAMRAGIDSVTVQHVRAGEDYGVAFVKRNGAHVSNSYAVMDIHTFGLMLARLQRAEDLLAQANLHIYREHRSQTIHERDWAGLS